MYSIYVILVDNSKYVRSVGGLQSKKLVIWLPYKQHRQLVMRVAEIHECWIGPRHRLLSTHFHSQRYVFSTIANPHSAEVRRAFILEVNSL